MKKIYLPIFLMLLLNSVSAQSYTLLANDPAGDATQPFAADVQSLSYRLDLSQDSIWFKVLTYNSMDPNGDVGLMFGLDTNLNPNDGLLWNGYNHSMKYDLGFLVFQDFMSPGYYGYLYYSSGSNQAPVVVLRPDSFTFIISTKLSLLDADAHFNLLFGSGAFDILSTREIMDDVPDSVFLSITGTTGIPEELGDAVGVKLYPNPASEKIVLENAAPETKYVILSMEGERLMEGDAGLQEGAIDITGLDEGIYLMMLYKKEESEIIRFVKAGE